jgi:hypothetical protein
LEPLLIGLRVYLGEAPRMAKEILEIAQDVAERIREAAHSGTTLPSQRQVQAKNH